MASSPLAGSLLVAVGWLAVAVLGLVPTNNAFFARRIAFPLGAAAGVALAAFGLQAVWLPPQILTLPLGLPDLPFHLRVDTQMEGQIGQPERQRQDLRGQPHRLQSERSERDAGRRTQRKGDSSREKCVVRRDQPQHGHREPADRDQKRACERRGSHARSRSEEHTSELQSLAYLVCRLLLEKKKKQNR